jgi:hypothetical protein
MFRGERALVASSLLVVALGFLSTASRLLAEPDDRVSLEAASPIYVRQSSLQETMLAARAALAEAAAAQGEARSQVKLGPWWLGAVAVANEVVTQAKIDLGGKTEDGKARWVEKTDWADARPFDVPGQGAVLCRTIQAEKPVLLLIGCGGGDRLSLHLNGRPVLSADTAITYSRYGTSVRLDGSRVDQVVCRLPLEAGENQLVMEVRQTSPGPRQAYFSVAPNAVPFLWQRLEEDFPRSRNRLLEVVRFDWFKTEGWFAEPDARFERQLLTRVLDERGQFGRGLREKLKTLDEEDAPATDRRWLDLCVTAAELHTAMRDLDRLLASVASLGDTFPDCYPGDSFQQRLGDLKERLVEKAAHGLDPCDPAARQLTAELDAARREMLVGANPLLKGERLLFIRRYTYDSQHFYDDYYHGIRKYGGSLSTLSIDDGAVKDVVPQLTGGVFDRFDLSFDAERVVFGYRPAKPEGFRIWEANLDDGTPKQLTFEPDDERDRMDRYRLHAPSAVQSNPILHGHWTDDMHPCYLPDGRIVFASSRCERTAVCGDHRLPCTVLYRINAGGAGMERLSQGMLSEFTPTLLDDGRVLYNRWEYVFKGIAAIQPLWAMRPDGSGSEEVYGNNVRDPGVLYQARQVPGHPNLIVSNGCGHEPLSVGSIVLLDLHEDKRTEAVMTNLTPDTEVRDLRGFFQRRNGEWRADDVYGPFYCDPYPLSDTHFLVSCNPEKRHNDESAYGIYLLDVFGNVVPVYDDPEMSCFVPTPLKSRKKPAVLPATSKPAATAKLSTESPSNESVEAEATVLLTDVYQGLTGVARGDVKYLRVLRQIPRPWSVWPYASDDRWPGQMVAVSWYSHIWIAVLEGVVPVCEDGSAYLRVPADCNLFFQALDENFMEIQRMRTFVNFRPGEQRSCIGCHERRTRPPAARQNAMPLALLHDPVAPGPQPGDVAPRPLHYESDVQPIFDKHCVSCHGSTEPDGELALTGEPTSHFNRSYEEIMSKELIRTVTEWAPPPGRQSSWHWSMEHAPTIGPYTYGSHASRLVEILRGDHYDVSLSQAEFVKVVTWVDTNGQYYGSYFGYRNVRYKDRDDFRPRPSLASARGVRPGTEWNEPLAPTPAELLAHWAFDEPDGPTAYDGSEGEHHGTIVGAERTSGKRGGALRFSGNADFVRVGDVGGVLETLSIALWVRAESHKNRWNPLLFCDDWSRNDLHLSLLSNGNVNVAINGGAASGHHRAADRSVGGGEWRHVALVCDQRPGGHIQFYVDGQPDRKHRTYGIETPVELTAVRLGGYNQWEKNAGANFHGSMDDVRIYRGMLTDDQVAELAAEGETHSEATTGQTP